MTRNTKKSDFLNSIQSNTKKRNIAEYVIIFLAITIVFILCKALGIKNDNDKTQILMIASLFGLMCDACYLGMKKQLTTTKNNTAYYFCRNYYEGRLYDIYAYVCKRQ